MTELELKIIGKKAREGRITGQVPDLYIAPPPSLQPEIDALLNLIATRKLWFKTNRGMIYGDPQPPHSPRNPATGRLISGFTWLTPEVFQEAKDELWPLFDAAHNAVVQPLTFRNLFGRYAQKVITREQWEMWMLEDATTGTSPGLQAFMKPFERQKATIVRSGQPYPPQAV